MANFKRTKPAEQKLPPQEKTAAPTAPLVPAVETPVLAPEAAPGPVTETQAPVASTTPQTQEEAPVPTNSVPTAVPETPKPTVPEKPKRSVINVIDVTKSFRVGIQDVQVLKGINFDIKEGDFAIIFGPSGSGKSTLLHTLLGLEPPSTGHVYFLDQDMYSGTTEDDRSEIRKRYVGMVYQQPNWVKSLSVVENVAFPLSLLGMEKTESLKRAWKALESISMSNWVSYYPAELSGGQQQRVALARALVTSPSVIIADEPTGNLDYEAGQELMRLLVKLNSEQGKTIVMVTHDLEYMSYAKTAVQFLDGRVVGTYSNEQKEDLVKVIKTKRI